MIWCGIKRVNVVTNHSMQLGIIVLSFSFYLTGIKEGENVSQVISLLGIDVSFLLSIWFIESVLKVE